ncbi:hypothetical protein [Neorhizobium sp. NCHU2750]|uniref:hypothetical protein n=1 Tax=Neorhizobium sp. NCHU2750 TaxID=1825976 RepID=UPI000E71C40D|nr:hypothetical protein NCHU2750_16530 [Neorhizobium sp. NCHU2750]
MPNFAKKVLPQDATPSAEEDLDDFDFASLDEMATMMVEALTIPLPGDFHGAGDAIGDLESQLKAGSALRHPGSRRIN